MSRMYDGIQGLLVIGEEGIDARAHVFFGLLGVVILEEGSNGVLSGGDVLIVGYGGGVAE